MIDISPNHLLIRGNDGELKPLNAIKGDDYIITPEDMETISEMVEDDLQPVLDSKMEYYILTFTGTAFTNKEGTALTYAQIKELCMDEKHFVYAQYQNRLYIPQYVSGTNIFFDANYVDSDKPLMHRISINSSNVVSQFTKELAQKSEVTSLSDGLANLSDEVDGKVGFTDYASTTKAGAVKIGTGMNISTGGLLSLSFAGPSAIANRLSWYPVQASNIDAMVKAAMTDGKGAEWTEEEQLSARQRLGLEKEWVLKGTIKGTTSTTMVDLSGCTEICVVGEMIGAVGINVKANNRAEQLVYTSATGDLKFRFNVMDNAYGISVPHGKYGNATGKSTQAVLALYDTDNISISDIFSIDLSGNYTSANVEIYAR